MTFKSVLRSSEQIRNAKALRRSWRDTTLPDKGKHLQGFCDPQVPINLRRLLFMAIRRLMLIWPRN